MTTTLPPSPERDHYVCGSLHSMGTIRIFTFTRLAITVSIILYVLVKHELVQEKLNSKKESALRWPNGGYKEIETNSRFFPEMYIEHKKLEDQQVYDFYQYSKDLIIIGCHISVTSLIWMGAMANKKSCLLFYILLEGILLLVSSVRLVFDLFERTLLTGSNSCVIAFGIVMASLFALNLVYAMFFVPRVILTYYCYVRDTDNNGKTTADQSKEDVEKALND